MILEKAGGKELNATVVAVGTGLRKENGDFIPCSVKPGDKVLLPEYGGTKFEFGNKEYFIFRDTDLIGKWSE